MNKLLIVYISLRQKSLYSALFWSAFSCIWTRINPNKDTFPAVFVKKSADFIPEGTVKCTYLALEQIHRGHQLRGSSIGFVVYGYVQILGAA